MREQTCVEMHVNPGRKCDLVTVIVTQPSDEEVSDSSESDSDSDSDSDERSVM